MSKARFQVSKIWSEQNNFNDKPKERRVVKFDNLGDPIYDDEIASNRNGLNILGIKVDADPLTVSLLIFGLIAFQFFVLANL